MFLDDALRFIQDHRYGPVYLHLSLQQPHADLNVPDQWRRPFLGRFEEIPFTGGHYRAEENPKATYAGMISYLDDSIGQVLAKLNRLGIAENTLVIFSS